jgi:hypothetical protein
VKILLIVLGCVGLCSCELTPTSSDSSFDEDHYVSPAASAKSRLTDPRMYMDRDDPNIQRLTSPGMYW